MEYGAAIERGVISAVESGGYRVKSDTRDGVTTPVLPYLGEGSLQANDKVYFFMFDDGGGAILAVFT